MILKKHMHSYIYRYVNIQGFPRGNPIGVIRKLEFCQMGRQSSDPIVMPSSIALLQERFRQLQRAKERREERELLRLFSKSEQVNPTACYEPSKFFNSELILPPKPPLQGSLYLQENLQSKHIDHQVTETPVLTNLWSADLVVHRPNNFDDSDVDTSLHL